MFLTPYATRSLKARTVKSRLLAQWLQTTWSMMSTSTEIGQTSPTAAQREYSMSSASAHAPNASQSMRPTIILMAQAEAFRLLAKSLKTHRANGTTSSQTLTGKFARTTATVGVRLTAMIPPGPMQARAPPEWNWSIFSIWMNMRALCASTCPLLRTGISIVCRKNPSLL